MSVGEITNDPKKILTNPSKRDIRDVVDLIFPKGHFFQKRHFLPFLEIAVNPKKKVTPSLLGRWLEEIPASKKKTTSDVVKPVKK